MEFRNRYIALYAGSVVVSLLGGLIFRNVGVTLLLLLVLRLATNIWYAQKLKLSIFVQLFVGVFSTIGLFYLLGHHPTLSPPSKLLLNLASFYEKNFKTIFISSFVVVAITLALIFAVFIIIGWLFTFTNNSVPEGVGLLLLRVLGMLIIAATVISVPLWFYGTLMHILDALITEEPSPALTVAIRRSLSQLPALFVSAALKAVYIVGPIIALFVVFLISSNSSFLSLSFRNVKSGLFSTYSALNILYYLGAIATYAYMWYIIIRLSFSNYGVLFSNISPRDSVRQSLWLSKGMWWPLAWRIFAANFVIGSVVVVMSGSFTYLSDFGGIISVIGYIGQLLLYTFFFPLLFSVPLYLYYELRNMRLAK